MLSHDSPHPVPVLARHLAQFHLQAVICCIQLLLLLSHLQRRWLSQPPAMTSRAANGLTSCYNQLLAALVQGWIKPMPPLITPCAARHMLMEAPPAQSRLLSDPTLMFIIAVDIQGWTGRRSTFSQACRCSCAGHLLSHGGARRRRH